MTIITRKEEITEKIDWKDYKIIFEIENDLNWDQEDLDYIKRVFKGLGSEKWWIAKWKGYIYWKIKKI